MTAELERVLEVALTDEPSVLAWRIALGPRPRHRPGRHWWRELVTSTYLDARHAWEALRESGTPAWNAAGAAHSGVACYQLSEDEFAELHPQPLLKDIMTGLSGGRLSPGV